MAQCVECKYEYSETFITKHGDICKDCITDFAFWLLNHSTDDKLKDYLSRNDY